MASPYGPSGAPLNERILREGYRFEFFQAVLLLESMSRAPAALRQPVGRDEDPGQETVRFRAHPSLTFPPSAIVEVRDRAGGAAGAGGAGGAGEAYSPPEMIVSFLGLTGPSGVLPHHYTRLLIERLRQKDESLRDFLDLFNHRLISFFFRAWEKHRFPAAYARARLGSSGSAEDRFTGYLFSLVGLGTPGLRERFPLDDETLLHYAGLFADGHRPAASLEGLLASYFDVPVRILQFQGQWLSLKPEDLATLARPGSPEAENAQLGRTAILGERVWDVQSRFRVKLGPLDYERYCDFIPSGSGLPPLWHLVRTYVGPSLDFDVQVTLRAGQAPPLKLAPGGEARLGWNTWLRTRPTESDFEEVVFVLPEF